MRVCLMVEGQEDVSWDEWARIADACERAGLEGLFRSDHYASVLGRPERVSLDAWATLSALAARTSRIRLGSLVSPATFRHPSLLARTVVTADHVSGGRVELGLGAGWFEYEHRAFGFPFPSVRERLALFEEQLEIVYREWTEDDVDFEGRHYRLVKASARPKPVQRPHPPLIVGGSARAGTVEPAVRFADEYNTIFAEPDECRRRRSFIDEACERLGRDPATLPLSLMTTCVVGRDGAELRRRADRVAARTGREPTPEGRIIGTLDEVVERLSAYEEAGVTRVMLQHLDHADVEMIELVGELARAVAA
jgi:F420-dependent oxidoreductase-like protein